MFYHSCGVLREEGRSSWASKPAVLTQGICHSDAFFSYSSWWFYVDCWGLWSFESHVRFTFVFCHSKCGGYSEPTIEIKRNFGVSVRSWPEPNLESYYVTMNALGRESARSSDVPVTSTQGWQSALELLEELPQRRLEASIWRLGEKSTNRERTWKGSLQHRQRRW